MAVPFPPTNLTAEQADGSILLSFTGSLGATLGYQVQRSLDGVNFTNLAISLSTQYIDSYPGNGIQYYYQVAGINGDGTGLPGPIVSAIAAPPGEMSLAELRLRSQQTADRVESQFVTTSEWNAFLRLAMYELYDLLIDAYEDYVVAPYAYINTSTDISVMQYALPNGSNYFGGVFNNPDISSGNPLPRFYKLLGVDLAVNTSNNAWVTLRRFDYIDRNAYVYPNSTSTIYGVYNMRYRDIGTNIQFIPTPAGNQQIRLTYIPVLPALLKDTDLTTIGYSGWLRYVIVRSAKYALNKEEGSDTTALDQELLFLKARIESAAVNRDAGMPDTISNTRSNNGLYGGNGWGSGGGQGGW